MTDTPSPRPTSARDDLVERLRRSITTASNDDYSKAGTVERQRHCERIEAMEEAADRLSLRQEPRDGWAGIADTCIGPICRRTDGITCADGECDIESGVYSLEATPETQPDLCAKDGQPCYIDGDEPHWRCGTVQCGMRQPPAPRISSPEAKELAGLLKRASIIAGMLRMGERIAFGSDADIIEELAAALASPVPPPLPGEAKPAAWQHRIYFEDTQAWSEWRDGLHDRQLVNSWEERPLYATPPARAPGITDEAVEAFCEAAGITIEEERSEYVPSWTKQDIIDGLEAALSAPPSNTGEKDDG